MGSQTGMNPAGGLRLALVGPLPPPSGGMANQTRQLAALLREAGLTVSLVQTNLPYRPVWVGRVRGLRALARLVDYWGQLRRALRDVHLVHVMANSGWSWHLFAAPAIWLARAAGVAVVVNYRGGEAAGFLSRQAAWVLPTLRRAQALVVPSGFLQDVFERHGVAATIVPNVVDLGRFSPPPPRPFAARFLVARNLEAIYDNATALRAFARIRAALPRAHLTVAGSGPESDALRRLAVQLRIEEAVDFCGRQDNDRMAQRFRDADVLLNASLADNMPISLLEAMASGVPIVTSNVGGIPYLVQHDETALLVPPRSPQAMADAALRLAGDAALRARLSEAGAQAAASYAWDRVRPRLFAVYAQCCAGTPFSGESIRTTGVS